MEQRIDQVMAQNESLEAEDGQELVKMAEEIIRMRAQSQGDTWWETIDARHRLKDLRRWLTLTPSQRADLAEAAELSQIVGTLNREGKYKEPLVPAEKRLDIERRIWGERHRNVARSLNDLAGLYLQQGNSAQALPLYEQALAIREQALGPEHPDTAQALNGLAKLYRATGAYTQAEPLAQRALTIWEQALGPEHPDTAQALYGLAALYQVQGQSAQAESFAQRALVVREKLLGPEHPDTALALNILAMVFFSTGAYAQAEPLYQRALAIQEKVLGPEHPHTAFSRNNLAALYQATGAYAQAEPLLQQALMTNEKVLGPEHPDTAIPRNNLAELYQVQGQYAQAEPLYKRALAIAEKVRGAEHPDTARSLDSLAALHFSNGDYAQAEPFAQRALGIREKMLGPQHPDTAASLHNLALLYQAQRQYARAEPLLQRVLAIKEQALGPVHPDTATGLHNLAELYWVQGAHMQAEPLYKRVLAIREQALGPMHSDTASTLCNLAELYQVQGQYAQAEPLYKRALVIREQALGPTHSDTAASLNNLAVLYSSQGAYTQAEPWLKRAIAIWEEALGPTHPTTIMSLNGLAILYRDQGQYAQAEPLYKRVLAIREQTLGPTHPDTANSLNSLAVLYQLQGQYAAAEPLHKRALAIWEQTQGPTHPDTANSLNSLAVLYQNQGQYAKAESLHKRALAIKEQTLGPEHPNTAMSLENLGVLYRDQGQYVAAEPLLQRALAIYEQALGPTHPDTAMSLNHLGILQTLSEPNAQAAKWLHRSAQSRWQYLRESFPSLTARDQQQVLIKSKLDGSDYLWHVLTQVPSVDRAVGYQVTLWTKQLVAEATRHESSALQRGLAKASPEWQALWRERETLRRAYATQSLHELSDTKSFRENDPRPVVSSTREIATRLEQLEQRLRRENPTYAQEATLQDITVAQVQDALQPDQALLEYVRFHPYDETTKQLATPMHYGVYVVRGPQTPVIVVDLGDAAPIDTAIRQFQKEMQRAEGYARARVTRSQKQTRINEGKLAQASSTLRRLVWQPVEKLLTKVTRIYVAPDGHLSEFPFEALAQKTTSGTWQYLVEERELVYLNTGRDLARLALTADSTSASNTSTRTTVLIGNPKFDARPKDVAKVVAGLPTTAPLRTASTAAGVGGTLGALPSRDGLRIPRDWSQVRELDTLLRHADQQLRRTGWTVTTWRDQQAVEAAVLQLEAPRILQFATHGYLLERATPEQTGNWDNPLLRSMLLLAGANHSTPEQTVFYREGKNLLTETEAEQRQLSAEERQQARIDIGDGILTAYEVSGMNLQGTELVNLTACKTGLGTVTPEGVVGLRQAFFFAGARALTTSLWEVPVSEATKQLEDFYARWLRNTKSKPGVTRYKAFRQTQLAALAQARKTYGAGHPFFWAGFIYLGDPGDLASGALRPN